VKIKLKRVFEESVMAAERAEEERRAEAELLQAEVARVNKLIKSAARSNVIPTTRQQLQEEQQYQAQRVTLEDVQRFKRTFDLFKVLRLPYEDGHQHSKSSSTISGQRAATAVRYLGCNPTEVELQELLREVALPVPEPSSSAGAVPSAAACDVPSAAAGMEALRVDFSGFVTMVARNMNSARKSEAELLAAFALFAAQTANATATASSASGAVPVPRSSGAKDTGAASVAARTVIPNAELRHILQNTGERMSPEHVDLVLAGSTGSTGNGEVDYALLARVLLA
jgi:hypothetical protein